MKWNEPPPMEPGAPLPVIEENGESLRCSYICANPDFPGWDSGAPSNHPGFAEYCAVVEFDNVIRYKFGAPNDEGLHKHPLYKMGVSFYEFYSLSESPELKLVAGSKLWVATFHDETLQVIAESARVLAHRVNVNLPVKALEYIRISSGS